MFASRSSKLYLLLVGINIFVWLIAVIIYYQHTISLSVCLLAYGFGLRHGFDADHVAAIDSVTRKLMEKSDQPGAPGFFFYGN